MPVKQTDPALRYIRDVIAGREIAPKYVIKQCKDVLPIFEGKDPTFKINEKKLEKIRLLLSVLRMPKGLSVGRPIGASLAGYQWLLIEASLCVVYRNQPKKRRYTNVVLKIGRKNGKTFVIGLIFILLFFFEPKYSRFFSVAPDGTLSREVKEAIEEIIRFNAEVFEMHSAAAFFKIRLTDIFCKITESKYVPLNYSKSRLDGRLPNVFLCDEVGALPNSYAFEAMRSGQLTILNKLGFLISTSYPTANNPFEEECEICKKILDGKFKDAETFSLLYEPDDPKHWQKKDAVLLHANPLAQCVPGMLDELKKKRARAIESEAARENFLCKHCNIVYQGVGTESFVPIDAVRACRKDKIDFSGREVWIGVDLAMTNDNCAVAMAAVDDDETILADVYAFIPEGRIEEKNTYEHVDYNAFIREMKCIACGDMTVDYSVIEKFVFDIEDKFGCTVVSIGYDRYNALSSAQKWEERFTTVQIRQHSDTLHAPTKLLFEKILNRQFAYERNRLLEINFENARCTFDTNMNRYVNKKRSNGKVDMVVALINALFLLQQDMIFTDDFVSQVI